MVERCDLSLLCLVETRNRADKIQDIHLLSGWSFEFCNSNQGLGEIWLVWNKDCLNVHICQKLPQVMHCKISPNDMNLNCCCSFGYASYDGIDRRELWQNLAYFKRTVDDFPWILVGDFNVVCRPNERLGGSVLNGLEMEFSQCVANLELVDHSAVGCFLLGVIEEMIRSLLPKSWIR